MSPLPSSGLPSGSTMRPSSASPTGISSRWPVRLTVSPSTIFSHVAEQHGADVVGLEVQREAGDVVRAARASRTTCSSRGRGRARCRRPTDRTVPTSVSSACAGVEALDAALEDAGDLVGLDLHVGQWLLRRPCATCLRSCSSRLRMEASRIELPTRTTMPPRMSGSTVLRRARPCGRSARRSRRRCCSTVAVVELDGARDLRPAAACSPRPQRVELAADRGRSPACGGSRSAARGSCTSVSSAPSTALSQAVLLLLGREVGREEEHLQLAVVVERVGELAELLAHVVELVVLLRRPRTATRA